MVMYKIETISTKKDKRIKVIIGIITFILLVLAFFGGINLAKYVNDQNQKKNLELALYKQENLTANQEGQEQIQQENSKGEQDNQGTNPNQAEQNISQSPNEQQDNQSQSENQSNINNSEQENQDQMQNNGQDQVQNNSSVSNQNGLTQEQQNAISNIYSSETKRAFLTFDDGPSSTVTPQILDTLKKENIKATFFVLGTMVKSNPQIIKRERQEGHYIANHGYSHVYSKVYANEKSAYEEYQKTNKLIQSALEDNTYQSNIFRFPGGSNGGKYEKIKTKTKKILKENGVAYLDWNCLTSDSAGAKTKSAIMKNLKSTCAGKNSIVILMHDAPNKKLTAETLPDVISYLRQQGYQFYSIEDIL